MCDPDACILLRILEQRNKGETDNMGLCSSSPDEVGSNMDSKIEENEKRKMATQRRRLSVAPEHVGDTQGKGISCSCTYAPLRAWGE